MESATLEQKLSELKAPRITEEFMRSRIVDKRYLRDGLTTICGVHPERFHDEYVRVTVLRNAREAQQKWLAAYIAPNRYQRGV